MNADAIAVERYLDQLQPNMAVTIGDGCGRIRLYRSIYEQRSWVVRMERLDAGTVAVFQNYDEAVQDYQGTCEANGVDWKVSKLFFER